MTPKRFSLAVFASTSPAVVNARAADPDGQRLESNPRMGRLIQLVQQRSFSAPSR